MWQGEPAGWKEKVKLSTKPASERWFWITLALSCATILALIFSLWELVEHRYFRDLDYSTLHYLYITRGIASSLLIGLWATWFVLRERRRHEEELERSRERYRSILNNTPEAVVLFDENFHVVEWNVAAERLYGIERQQVLGQVLPTVPAQQWSELVELIGRVKGNQAILEYETERCTGQGERIPVAVSYTRMPLMANQSQFFLEVAQDIRPRLRLRDKLLEVEKLALMGQMAAGTAHHLNTPLTAMLLQVEMLRQRVQNSDGGAELSLIENRIRFCQTFVQNLLRFGHRSQMKRKRVSLCEVIEVVVTLLQPNLGLKKASLRNDLDSLRHCCILGDPNRLEVMFSALVNNAVAAIPVGGSIHIHGEAKRDHQSEIYIDDNGGGIPDQLWSQVFEPFFTTKPAGQGTGLGLAIARNIAEEHGGDLRLQNRTGGGVRATVRLPLLDVEAVSGTKEKNV